MRRVAVAAMASVLIGVLGGQPAAAQTDAISVARGLIAAENAHDVGAAVAFFSPGAVVTLPTGVFIGHTQITQWQRELAAGNLRVEISPPVAVTPEIVTFSGTVAFDSFRALGVSPLEATWQLTVQLGLITTFDFAFTPAAAARLQAALAGGGAAGSASGGSTAGGGPGGGQGTAATPSAARSLALTGPDLGLLGSTGLAFILLGAIVLAAGGGARRRQR